MSLARFVCHACYQMKVSCNLSFPMLPFRGGGWQGFAALPQPALLQGLSGPRPPADHQRQPLPPHCSLWVLFLSLWPLPVFNPFFLSHYVSYCPFLCFSLFLIDRCVDFSLLSLPPALFPSLSLFYFSLLAPGMLPLCFFITCILSLRLSPPSIAPSFPSVVRLLSSQPEVSTATTLLSRGLRCLGALPPSAHARHAQHIQRYTKIITHHSLGCIRTMFLFFVCEKFYWLNA